LVARGPVTLIDFDRCAFADPAFDVGRLLADLHWWFTTYDQDGLEQAQAQFLKGYAPGNDRLLRARLWEAVELTQMTVLRARVFEGRAACRTGRLIGRAQAVLHDLERTLGVPASPLTVVMEGHHLPSPDGHVATPDAPGSRVGEGRRP